MIDYLQEENRVLRAGLRGKRLRLSDDERRRLAVKAQALGREALAQIAVWSKYSNAQRVSSLHLPPRPLESAIAVGYVFQFSGRSCDGLEDHAELHLRIRG